MSHILAETPEERRKERDETFCIRMIELSILATTLCGIMISFSYQGNPAVLFLFLFSSSFFIASGMGLIFLILLSRGYFAERLALDRMERLRGLSIMFFFFGMVSFLLAIAYMTTFNVALYIAMFIPFLIILFSFGYYFYKYKVS